MNAYDAIVIGSGISGGWAAKELTEKGLKVLLLERGRNIEHIKDYVNANKEAWDYPHRGTRTSALEAAYPVLKRKYTLNETNLDFWVKDNECPYTENKRFDWIRGYQIGGRSLTWGRQCYRWSDYDFEANAREGIAIDWPIRYADIEPWYTHVEKFAGISGSIEHLPYLPDGHFLPPYDMTCVEKDVSSRLKEHYKGLRQLIIGRVANITVPHQGRPGCQFRNKCWLGCPFGGYFSTQSSTLPAAVATGNLTIRPWSIVTKILYNKNTKKATGVQVLDAETNLTYEFASKIVFLNASTLNSAWVLMNSATDVWPDGLGSSSGELGHNLMDHHQEVGAGGSVDGYEDKYYYGRRANGIYIPRFRNLPGEKRDYLRGFGYQGGAGREGYAHQVAEYSIGREYKAALAEPGPWSINIVGFGETLPYHDNRVTLDKTRKDKWGLAVLAMDAEMKDNEHKMRKDMEQDAKEMLEVAGAKNIRSFNAAPFPGRSIHEMGTARMGREAKTSVLNAYNQVWDAKNVFVTDGSFMTSANCVNPSLTYMAMTARAADHAVKALKSGNL